MPKMPKRKSPLEEFVDRFRGNKPVEIAKTNEDIELADFVICVLASDLEALKRFPDNVFDFCCDCGEKLQLRPHVPAGPKRICYGCGAKLANGDEPVQMMISERTAVEYEKYRKKI